MAEQPKKGIGKPKFEKVRILTLKGRPWGIVVATFRDKPRIYETSYWVRLNDGILLKDMQKSELEFEYERIQAKCIHKWEERKEIAYYRCQKCGYMVKI